MSTHTDWSSLSSRLLRCNWANFKRHLFNAEYPNEVLWSQLWRHSIKVSFKTFIASLLFDTASKPKIQTNMPSNLMAALQSKLSDLTMLYADKQTTAFVYQQLGIRLICLDALVCSWPSSRADLPSKSRQKHKAFGQDIDELALMQTARRSNPPQHFSFKVNKRSFTLQLNIYTIISNRKTYS